MSGIEEALSEGNKGRTRSGENGVTLIDGLFYGGIAYFIGYLLVYINIMNEDIPNEAAAALFGEEYANLSEEEAETIQLFLPGEGEYAGWVYHYAMGGSVDISANLFPGSYPIDESFLYHFDGGAQDRLRETVLNEPWMLLHPSEALQYVQAVQDAESFAAMSFVFVTPTALFIAGFLIAYRNNEMTPIGGAIAGSKVTSGFLLVSMASTYIFTVSISGFSYGAEASLGALGVEAGTFAEVDPIVEVGPSLTRAILIGIVYPLAFATMGGAAASGVAVTRLPASILNRLR